MNPLDEFVAVTQRQAFEIGYRQAQIDCTRGLWNELEPATWDVALGMAKEQFDRQRRVEEKAA